jgi:hypothetical protein
MVRLINRSVPLGVSWRPSEDRNRIELRAAVRQLKSYFSDVSSLTLAWYDDSFIRVWVFNNNLIIILKIKMISSLSHSIVEIGQVAYIGQWMHPPRRRFDE